MIEFLQQLINGLSLGAIYALIALGYTMVYGILQMINFAHGEVYMLGAFIAYYLITYLHFGFVEAMLVSMVITAIIGMIIEALAYRPLRKASRISVLLTAIGVSMFLQNVGFKIFGADPKSFDSKIVFPGGETSFAFFDDELIVEYNQIIVVIVSVVLMIALTIIVKYTKLGKAMRAVAFDKDAAMLMGINVNKIIAATFAIGSALAAAAGILVAMTFPKIDPAMGMMPGLKAFVAAVLGGIGSIPGAVLGGFIMGTSETMVTGYISSSYKDAIAFIILIAILIVKPTGIFGKNVKEKV